MSDTGFQFALAVGARTERGRREENQDRMSAFSVGSGYVYLIADGMGGHRGGMDASRLVAEGFREHLSALAPDTPLPEALERAASAVHAELLQAGAAADATKGMGSTVVLAAFLRQAAADMFLVAHVGDSRAYLWRGGSLRRLTADHSVVQRMVGDNLLTPDEARSHPHANILTRAFGQQASISLEISPAEPVQDGDVFLLCSDGLWGSIGDDVLAEQLAAAVDPDRLAEQLVQLALARGSDDNITVQVIRLTAQVHALPVKAPTSNAGRRTGLLLALVVLLSVLAGVGAYLIMLHHWPAITGRRQHPAPITDIYPVTNGTDTSPPRPVPGVPARPGGAALTRPEAAPAGEHGQPLFRSNP